MKVSILTSNAYGLGDTACASLNLASCLADHHDVEVISLARHRDVPLFRHDRRVRLSWLSDTRESPGGPLARLVNRGTDAMAARALKSGEFDVLIAMEPSLGPVAVRYAPRRTKVIGRDDGPPDAHPAKALHAVRRTYGRLDALATREGDDASWAELLPAGRIRAIAPVLPGGAMPRSRVDNRIIATAGRQAPPEAGRRLVEAMARVVEKRPDWCLRIYGGDDARLRSLVLDRQLHNHIYFMGRTSDIEGAFAKASIVAVTATGVGVGLTQAEALGCGVPVVSHGQGRIITHGVDGLVVPEDGDDLADALLRLIEDQGLRGSMAAMAVESAGRFAPETVAGRWNELLDEVVTGGT